MTATLTLLFRCFSLLVLTAPAHDVPQRDHVITIDDYFTIGVITDCAASPDGKLVAYTELRWEPPNEKRNQDLWLVDAATKNVARLTFDAATETAPRWSPDGRWIYYTANAKREAEKNPPWDGSTQVWRISPHGGEPMAVTRVKDGIGHFELSRDGRTLYYTTDEEQLADEWKDLRGKYKDDIEFGHGIDHLSAVWKLDLANWRAEKIIDEKRHITALAVAPNQLRVAMLTTPNEHLISNEGQSRVDIWDAGTKSITTLPDKLWRADAPSPYGWLDGLAWSSDSASLAFTVSFDGYPSELFVATLSADATVIHKVTRPHEIYVTPQLEWKPGTRELCFAAVHRARTRIYRVAVAADGKPAEPTELTPGDVTVGAFSFAADGNGPAYVSSGLTHPPEVFVQHGGSGVRLTNVNPQVDTWKLPSIQLVQWKAPDGVEVEGILELPPDHEPGKPLPMVVEIHGGPTDCAPFCLQYWIYGRTLLPATGYALLTPNYRGSTGYGDQFLTDLIGRENDVEVKDILAGVDAMIERGIADANKLGVIGWSNGGYLTNCIITTTERFKAASSGAGVLDMLMQWGIEDTPGHVINYMKGFPWDRTEAYVKASPSFRLDRVRTPTLIHVGGNDARVPPAHSRTLHRALKEYVKVPTELLVYPNEGHGLTTYKNRKAKMEWDLAWFDRFILNPPSEPAKEATD